MSDDTADDGLNMTAEDYGDFFVDILTGVHARASDLGENGHLFRFLIQMALREAEELRGNGASVQPKPVVESEATERDQTLASMLHYMMDDMD